MPSSPERIRTRSQTWLAIQRPRPLAWVDCGRTRPASGCSMRPASVISTTSVPGSRQKREVPWPPPWRTLLAASSLAARTRSALRARESSAAAHSAAASSRRSPRPPWSKASSRALVGAAGEGPRERVRRGVQLAALAVRAAAALPGEIWVAARRLLQHLVLEQAEVVGAEQRPGRHPPEGDVEQRLVALALVDLGGGAAGPDRFADAAPLPARGDVLVDELAPGGDDARGVAPERFHVGEGDPLGVRTQLAPQQLRSLRSDRDQRRLLGLQRAHHEGHRSRQEALVAVVEHHFVAKPGVTHDSSCT